MPLSVTPPAGIATGLMRLTWAPQQVRKLSPDLRRGKLRQEGDLELTVTLSVALPSWTDSRRPGV